MATKTLGTNATTSLTALQFQSGGLSQADVATIAQSIKSQPGTGTNQVTVPGAWNVNDGRLFLPEKRGVIMLKPGDYIGVDAAGWPIVVSAFAIGFGSTSWTHS